MFYFYLEIYNKQIKGEKNNFKFDMDQLLNVEHLKLVTSCLDSIDQKNESTLRDTFTPFISIQKQFKINHQVLRKKYSEQISNIQDNKIIQRQRAIIKMVEELIQDGHRKIEEIKMNLLDLKHKKAQMKINFQLTKKQYLIYRKEHVTLLNQLSCISKFVKQQINKKQVQPTKKILNQVNIVKRSNSCWTNTINYKKNKETFINSFLFYPLKIKSNSKNYVYEKRTDKLKLQNNHKNFKLKPEGNRYKSQLEKHQKISEQNQQSNRQNLRHMESQKILIYALKLGKMQHILKLFFQYKNRL